jgi:hypothetical protein
MIFFFVEYHFFRVLRHTFLRSTQKKLFRYSFGREEKENKKMRGLRPFCGVSSFQRGLSVVSHVKRHLLGRVEPGQVLSLSPSERAMVRVSNEMRGSMKVTVAVTLQGNMEPEKVIAVAAKLSELHPVLQCSVNEALELCVRPDVVMQTVIHQVAEQNLENECEKIWANEIEKEPLQFGKTLARVDFVRGRNDCAIMLSCEHAFCDARSLTHLCHQMLQLLGGTNLKERVQWAPSFEFASGGLDPNLVSPRKLALRMEGLKRFPSPKPEEVAVFPMIESQSNSFQLAQISTTRVQRIVFSDGESLRLVELCRKAESSISSVLGSVIMTATAQIISGDRVTVGLSSGADTRKYYSPSLSDSNLCYHVSGVPTFAISIIPANVDVWKLAAEYRSHVVDAIAHEYPLAISGFIGKLWSALLDKNALQARKSLSCSLTSWGVTHIQSHYGSNIHVTGVLPFLSMSYTNYPVFVAHTSANKLSLSLLTSRKAIAESDSIKLIQCVKSLLLMLIKESKV